jgi:hypothetical protein
LLSAGQIPQRVDRLTITPDFEVKDRFATGPFSHQSDGLSRGHPVSLDDPELSIVTVGAQIGLIMLDNDKPSVTD